MLNKNILIILMVTMIVINLISAVSVELLITSSDGVLSASPKEFWTDEMLDEERTGTGMQGYITEVRQENCSYGTLETDPSRFVRVRIPEEEWNESWIEPEYDYNKPVYTVGVPCFESCYNDYCNQNSSCNDYCEDNCTIVSFYEVWTERKYRLPLESFLTEGQINWIKNVSCDNTTVRYFPIINVTSIYDKIIYNNYSEKPFDWVRAGQTGCEYYSSLGKWYVENNVIVGYPQYNGMKQKVLVINEQVNLTSEDINLQIAPYTQIVSMNLSWDGNVSLPYVNTNFTGIGGVEKAVSVGFSNVHLSLNKSARMFIPEQAGNKVGYIDEGEFYEINVTCPSTINQTLIDSFLGNDEDCKINSGRDLIIWTRHFTDFVSYYPDELQTWLKFDGDSNDSTDNLNNGIVYGATLTTDRFNELNSAYYFDGIDDYIDLGNNKLGINNTNEFTISLWFNQFDVDYYDTIISRGQYAYPFWIFLGENKIISCIRTLATYYLYGNNVYDDEWYHLVVTYKNGSRIIYIDGEISNSDEVFGDLYFDVNENISIGKLTNSEHYFNGKIDDVRIYNKALNEDEINNLFF